MIVGSMLLSPGTYLLSTIQYDTNFALVSVYMFLLGAGVGMTMQNLVLIVQNTANPREIGVASSGVTFFRSLGGTIGVSVMGAALASKVTELILDAQGGCPQAAIARLGDPGPPAPSRCRAARSRRSSAMPEALRVIFEDIYAQGISHSFLDRRPVRDASASSRSSSCRTSRSRG